MNEERILIIDDEMEICLNMQEAFRLEGYQADFATAAKEAFEKLSLDLYDLILVDVKLGGIVSGVDIIKSFAGKAKRPKIIVISAIPSKALSPTFEKEELEDLIDEFLDKPACCDPEKLVGAARRLLQ